MKEGKNLCILFSLWLFLESARVLSASFPPSRNILCKANFPACTFAHRGLFDHLSRPENSLAAFSAAVEHGYGIELDLQMTADGKIVVFHDESLQRMCSTPLKIEQSTFAELQKHPLLNSDQTIPLFSEVLQLVDGKVPLIVEIKSTEHYEPLCLKVYDLLRRYPGDYCVESMNPMMMGWFAKMHHR